MHPNDDTGDALWRLESHGDDLTRARDIDFSIVFPTEDAARRFANNFREQGYKASVHFAETTEEFPWDVNVVKHMAPSHREIADFEASLHSVADGLGGHNDGWGCFSEES